MYVSGLKCLMVRFEIATRLKQAFMKKWEGVVLQIPQIPQQLSSRGPFSSVLIAGWRALYADHPATTPPSLDSHIEKTSAFISKCNDLRD